MYFLLKFMVYFKLFHCFYLPLKASSSNSIVISKYLVSQYFKQNKAGGLNFARPFKKAVKKYNPKNYAKTEYFVLGKGSRKFHFRWHKILAFYVRVLCSCPLARLSLDHLGSDS